MKNRDLYELHDGLMAVSNLPWARFAYGVSKNKRMLVDYITDFQAPFLPSEEYKAYDAKRVELCEKHAIRNDDAEKTAKVEDGLYVFKDSVKAKKDLDALVKENKEIVDAQKAKVEAFQKVREEESTFEPFIIKQETLPESITSEQLSRIFFVVE